jgi:hypothetical protein
MAALFSEAIGGQYDGIQHGGLYMKHGETPQNKKLLRVFVSLSSLNCYLFSLSLCQVL